MNCANLKIISTRKVSLYEKMLARVSCIFVVLKRGIGKQRKCIVSNITLVYKGGKCEGTHLKNHLKNCSNRPPSSVMAHIDYQLEHALTTLCVSGGKVVNVDN